MPKSYQNLSKGIKGGNALQTRVSSDKMKKAAVFRGFNFPLYVIPLVSEREFIKSSFLIGCAFFLRTGKTKIATALLRETLLQVDNHSTNAVSNFTFFLRSKVDRVFISVQTAKFMLHVFNVGTVGLEKLFSDNELE